MHKRPDHIEYALTNIHSGQWFTWTDSKNKIYANLQLAEKIGVNGDLVDNLVTELPTDKELKNMNNWLKETGSLYLKIALGLLAVAGVTDIAQIVIYVLPLFIIIIPFYPILKWVAFGVFNLLMVSVLFQSLCIHCLFGFLSKVPCLHKMATKILNWIPAWDEQLHKKDANDASQPKVSNTKDNVQVVLQLIKYSKWLMYFAIPTIVLICIAQFTNV